MQVNEYIARMPAAYLFSDIARRVGEYEAKHPGERLIRMVGELEGYRVLEPSASNGEEALEKVSSQNPDLVILDVMMPKLDGITTCERVRQFSNVPIIMLTARGEEQDKVTGLEIGADDYVTKPFSPRELVARIKAVLRRRAPQVTDDAVELGGLRLDPATHRVSAGDTALALGPTEFRLLHFLMTHPERVHSRAQLLDQVWGDHVFVEERTVDVHIRRLRSALEPTQHDALIQTVRGSGYRFSVHAHQAPVAS